VRIRAHLALIATATLVPVILFSAVSLNLLLDAERKAALKSLHETARSTALIVDRELGSAEAGLRILAGSPQLDSGDLAGFYAQAKSLKTAPGTWTVLFDRQGRQLLNTVVPFGTVLPAGDTIARSGVEAVIGSQKTQVSNLLVGPITKARVTTLGVPVPAGGGQRYVLAQVFTADYFDSVFDKTRVAADWTAAIFDRNGYFIARSRKAEEMVGRPARPELVASSRKTGEGEVRHKTWEGIDSFDVFTHSDLSGWTIAVAVPAELVESAARHAVLLSALGLLAALLAAAGSAALVSRRLVASIHGVDASAAALARGEAPALVHTGIEEMDKLSSALAGAGTILMQEKHSRQEAEAERARLLENERIGRQQAEQQNHAKDQFLAMLGHELRNPLSAISGAIAVMKARDASAALNTRAHTIIERQSNHLSHIVDDLLDLSRMSMGKITLHKQPLDLAAVVYASVDGLHAAGRVGQCDIGIEAEPVWIDADRTRLDQIIGNVLGNALKFSSLKGRIDLTVACDTTDAIWTVRDFGIGIAEDLMPNIFDAFVQGAAQADHTLGGLGIGLNLVRQLVELHDGTISVTSEGVGTGTTVVVRLPLSRAVTTEATAAVLKAPAALPQEPAIPAAMSTVLLIEDNADSREMMSMLLGMLGYQVLEAANGIDGLQLATREQPAIAVIDIGLPDIDGYEVARKLRADACLQGMTLIALTGYGQDADRKRALAAGFDSHLVKPLDMDVLVNTIVGHQAKQRAHPHDAGNAG
jgi:signal transduction histidine kinase/CheY-like chemotaxis protein